MKELIKIQNKLKASKSQYNSFGNYSYRSCEDILESLKPLLNEYGCFVSISDDICLIGDRYYVKATAKVINSEGTTIEASAFAREPESKKGMDLSQITGSSSSYARKSALNGLFAIDDTKDADTMDNSSSIQKETQQQQQEIEWLTDDKFKLAMSCGNANKILATIKAYSTPSKKMKKEYKEQLTKQAEILK